MNIRTQYPDLFLSTMLPALDGIIFNRFNRMPPNYPKFFRVMTSRRSIEQTSEVVGLGTFVAVAEGANVRYDESTPGFNKTYTHAQYGLGFKISRIMVDDDRWGIINKMADELGRSAKETVEIDAASMFNNGFNGAYPGPDGQPLFSTSHPLVKNGGVQNNTLAVSADLDIASLELALTDFRQMKDQTGKKIRVIPKQLIVAPANVFAASEILNGPMRSDTANHTINAFKNNVGVPGFDGLAVWEYLVDPDAWFIMTDPADTEMRFYMREAFNTLHDVDFDSRSIKTAGWMRYSYGWSSFYGVYGVPGA